MIEYIEYICAGIIQSGHTTLDCWAMRHTLSTMKVSDEDVSTSWIYLSRHNTIWPQYDGLLSHGAYPNMKVSDEDVRTSWICMSSHNTIWPQYNGLLSHGAYANPYPAVKPMSTAAHHDYCCGYPNMKVSDEDVSTCWIHQCRHNTIWPQYDGLLSHGAYPNMKVSDEDARTSWKNLSRLNRIRNNGQGNLPLAEVYIIHRKPFHLKPLFITFSEWLRLPRGSGCITNQGWSHIPRLRK